MEGTNSILLMLRALQVCVVGVFEVVVFTFCRGGTAI